MGLAVERGFRSFAAPLSNRWGRRPATAARPGREGRRVLPKADGTLRYSMIRCLRERGVGNCGTDGARGAQGQDKFEARRLLDRQARQLGAAQGACLMSPISKSLASFAVAAVLSSVAGAQGLVTQKNIPQAMAQAIANA